MRRKVKLPDLEILGLRRTEVRNLHLSLLLNLMKGPISNRRTVHFWKQRVSKGLCTHNSVRIVSIGEYPPD